MKPYYEDEKAGIVIYHGDSTRLLSELSIASRGIGLTLTDPPYGVEGGHGGQLRDYKKADYAPNFADTPEYIRGVVVPVIEYCRIASQTLVVTPGTRCMSAYPQPDEMGCFFAPAASRIGKFGFQSCHPIFYYGRYIYAGKGAVATGIQLTEISEDNGHPCPKPIGAWKWLLNRSCLPGELVLDPFAGSGTTLVAAKDLGNPAIGIEIEERYCEIAAKRLSQEVLQFKRGETA